MLRKVCWSCRTSLRSLESSTRLARVNISSNWSINSRNFRPSGSASNCSNRCSNLSRLGRRTNESSPAGIWEEFSFFFKQVSMVLARAPKGFPPGVMSRRIHCLSLPRVGKTPALTTEDLPLPEAPMTGAKLVSEKRLIMSSIIAPRPKKNATESASNASNPWYGLQGSPFFKIGGF